MRQQVGGGRSASEFFGAIPTATKWMCLAIVVFALDFTLEKPIHPAYLVLDWSLILSKLQIWRPFTSLFVFGPIKLGLLFQAFFFLMFSRDLEEIIFNHRLADYVYCLLIGTIIFLPFSYYFGTPVLSFSLLAYIMYVSCNFLPDRNMSIMFLPIQIPAVWFPWVQVAMSLLVPGGGGLVSNLMGIFAGHVYWFFGREYPKRTNGRTVWWMQTPSWLERVFEPRALSTFGVPAGGRQGGGGRGGLHQQRQRGNGDGANRAFAGEGRRLGD